MTKAKSKSKGGHTQKAGMSMMFKGLIGLAIVMVLGLLFYFFGGSSSSSSTAPETNYKIYMAYGLPSTLATKLTVLNPNNLVRDYTVEKKQIYSNGQNDLATLQKYCFSVCDKDEKCAGFQLSPTGICMKLTTDDLEQQGEQRADATFFVKAGVKNFSPNPPGLYEPFIAPAPTSS